MRSIRFFVFASFLLVVSISFVISAPNFKDEFVPPTIPNYDEMPIDGIAGKYGCLIMQSTDLKEKAKEPKGYIQDQTQGEIVGIVEGYTLRTNDPMWDGEPLDLKKIVLKGILVTDIFSQTYSDQNGGYSMDSDKGVILSLPFRKGISIIESSGKRDYFPMRSFILQKYKPKPIGNLTYPNESLDVSQINVYYHTQKAVEWLGYEPEHIYVFTNSKGVKCNAHAHLSDKYISFGQEAVTYSRHCPNSAYSTLIVHEYGHQLLEDFHPFPVCSLNGPCEFSDFYGYHEGFGDAFSLLVLGDKCIAKDLYGKGKGCLRDVDEDWIFPVDPSLGPHERGRPLASSFWDLRVSLIESYGEEHANEVLRDLFIYMAKNNRKGLHKELTRTVLEADRIYYGLEHQRHIVRAFTKHGFSSG